MPKGGKSPRFPRENMILRFLAGQEHFSRLSPRITAYDIKALTVQGFNVVKHWDQDRMTEVFRPDDMTAWQTRYSEIAGALAVKRPVGRPTGTPNPNGGRKASKTWEQRHRGDPAGSGVVLVGISFELARRLERKAKQEGTTVPQLLLQFAERALDQESKNWTATKTVPPWTLFGMG